MRQTFKDLLTCQGDPPTRVKSIGTARCVHESRNECEEDMWEIDTKFMSFLLARFKFYISSPFERVWEKGRFCHLAYLLLMNILLREIQTFRPYYVRADKERERESL